ncbi:uncharacterized protein FOMMEDRAFT_29835 [Fomitiporia mediterranea MF3/22]|uniref:uncharacterized protein n=1 Tax=Fomitiporia mediterranea (strain MF3/22) TaxID=694068 RepID=UPI0004408CD4|nr:uncharacterized protein FOMMEDRAFT_29835 [Fomitiporia mediterranea MF3/22]EJD01059.1 hypothetical protein FOMMEDRAFT_29835 [Fomitiporia mediterranea MF3/22]
MFQLDNTKVQSDRMRTSLDCFSSTPPSPPMSSDHIFGTSPNASGVLRSPFGEDSPGLIEVSPFTVSDLLQTEGGIKGPCNDMNGVSDSGESSTCVSATSTTFNGVPMKILATPLKADRQPSTEGIVCAVMAGVDSVDSTKPANEQSTNTPTDSVSAASEDASLTAPDEHHQLTVEPNGSSSSNEELSNKSHELGNENGAQKRTRNPDDSLQAPAPKRMTLAAQKKQHQKLSTPFRSPLVARPKSGNTNTPNCNGPTMSQPSPLSSAVRQDGDEDKPSTPLKNNARAFPASSSRPHTPVSAASRSIASTAKAKSQFKSPLMSSPTAKVARHINNSRVIQDMERQVQLLKRAIKIKQDNDEEKLEQLVKKWRTAGREAAWDLWQLVRDNDESSNAPYPGTNSKSAGGAFSESWGWAGPSGTGTGNDNWGWDESPKETCQNDDHDEELESPSKLENELYGSLRKKATVPRTSMLPPTPRGAYFAQQAADTDNDTHVEAEDTKENDSQEESSHTAHDSKSLGTMLHQLGIAHETLGWVEEEGDFVDA